MSLGSSRRLSRSGGRSSRGGRGGGGSSSAAGGRVDVDRRRASTGVRPDDDNFGDLAVGNPESCHASGKSLGDFCGGSRLLVTIATNGVGVASGSGGGQRGGGES